MNNIDVFIDNTVKISDYINANDFVKKNDGMKIDFSVIIPCFNSGETLERTVASVLSQTLKNIEIIIINDASTDEQTIKKIKELERYVSVIYLDKNGGLSNARNTGIKASSSEYVLCLDSDDFIEDVYLEKAKEIFDSNNQIGVVSPSVQTFGEMETSWTPKKSFSVDEILSLNQVPVASCVRKTLYNDVGGYDTNLRAYEDWEFWIRVFTSDANWKNVVLKDKLFYYNVHGDSMQHSMTRDRMLEVLTIIFNKHEEFYKKYSSDIFCNLHIQHTFDRFEKRHKDAQLKQKNDKIKQKNDKIKQKNEYISELKSSTTFRLGDLFFRSIKEPYKLMIFPYNVIKILLKK